MIISLSICAFSYLFILRVECFWLYIMQFVLTSSATMIAELVHFRLYCGLSGHQSIANALWYVHIAFRKASFHDLHRPIHNSSVINIKINTR
jgi:hypothetical protein